MKAKTLNRSIELKGEKVILGTPKKGLGVGAHLKKSLFGTSLPLETKSYLISDIKILLHNEELYSFKKQKDVSSYSFDVFTISNKKTYQFHFSNLNFHLERELGIAKEIIAIIQKKGGKSSLFRKAISNTVKREVWRRDKGCCVECGSKENLEYDHIIPFSKGGANTVRNIQLLCEHCNRSKGASI